MKVYIAAPWHCREQAAQAQDDFESAGIEVSSHWIKNHLPNVENLGKSFGELAAEASEDVTDLLQADVFVILNLDKSEGKAFEMGIAHALGIPIILVGDRTRNVFYYLDDVTQVDSVEDAIKEVEKLEVI